MWCARTGSNLLLSGFETDWVCLTYIQQICRQAERRWNLPFCCSASLCSTACVLLGSRWHSDTQRRWSSRCDSLTWVSSCCSRSVNCQSKVFDGFQGERTAAAVYSLLHRKYFIFCFCIYIHTFRSEEEAKIRYSMWHLHQVHKLVVMTEEWRLYYLSKGFGTADNWLNLF